MRHWLVIATVAFLSVSCSDDRNESEVTSDGKPLVSCVNYPLYYFAQRIAGDLVELDFPADSSDPAYWEPTDKQIAKLQKSDLLLLNGADYAKWRENISLPNWIQVDTSEQFADKLITVKDAATHSHGGDGEHSHDGLASTVWLDPSLAAQQVSAISKALSNLLPEKEAELTERTNSLLKDLAALDSEWKDSASALKGKKIISSHPFYHYLARKYGLNVESVHWLPDQAPGEKELSELKNILQFGPAQFMIWEAQPIPEALKASEKFGIKSVIFSPCDNRPAQGDWLTVMQQNGKNLAAAGSQ